SLGPEGAQSIRGVTSLVHSIQQCGSVWSDNLMTTTGWLRSPRRPESLRGGAGSSQEARDAKACLNPSRSHPDHLDQLRPNLQVKRVDMNEKDCQMGLTGLDRFARRHLIN